MVKPENFDYLHLVYHFTVPLKQQPFYSGQLFFSTNA